MLRIVSSFTVITLITFALADAQKRNDNNISIDKNIESTPFEIFKNLIFDAETLSQSDPLKSQVKMDSAMQYNSKLDTVNKFINLTFLGRHYWQKGNMDSALNIFSRLQTNVAEIHDKNAVARYYSNSGLLYYSIGDYQKSIESHWSSINLSREINDTIGIAKGYNNLGIVYLMMDEPDKALDYHTRSLKLCEEKNISHGIANCLGNIGIVYRKKNEFDKAIEVYLRSLAINKKIGDRYNESLNYNNLGAVYEYKEDYKKALENYSKSLQIRKELNDKSGVALALHNIATIYRKTGDFGKAEKKFYEALSMAKETQNKVVITETNKGLSELYELKGENGKALAYRKIYELWKDSINNEENYKSIKNLEYKYETEKKENEILTLNHQKSLDQAAIQRKNSLIKMMFVSLILVVIIFILAITLFIQRSRAREKIFAKEKALDKMKDDFFTGITHEFKTPLTLILDPVQSLIDYESNLQKKDTLHIIKNNGKKLLNLVNELLTLSKIEAGKQPIYLSKVNLKEFTKSTLAVYQSMAKSKNIRFKVTQLNTDIDVEFDKQKIEKVINNLLENALKFTPTEGFIFFSANIENNIFEMKIKDTGPGITVDDQKKIFSKYYSGSIKPDTSQLSFGIGLALSKEFVEMHNGNITVSSKPGYGTEFNVQIPIHSKTGVMRQVKNILEETSPDSAKSQIIDSTTEKTELSENTPLILIVEDNIDLIQHVKKTLERNYKIKISKNGSDGFNQAKKHIPDLILSDVIMPKMDGIEMCHKIKEDEVTNHIPVILLTAKSDVEDRMKGFATGADDYIPKPFQMEEIEIRINNLINQRMKLREKYSKDLIHSANGKVKILSRDDTFLRKANSIIEKNILEDSFDVNILAKELGTSRMQLHRKLKAITGSSTSEYVRNYRLHKAAELIRTDKATIAEIAYEVGFNKPAYFSECFKKLYNLTPLEFQRSAKGKKSVSI